MPSEISRASIPPMSTRTAARPWGAPPRWAPTEPSVPRPMSVTAMMTGTRIAAVVTNTTSTGRIASEEEADRRDQRCLYRVRQGVDVEAELVARVDLELIELRELIGNSTGQLGAQARSR